MWGEKEELTANSQQQTTMNLQMSQYFSGEKLYGDDFTQPQIDEWFKDEQEGYANLSEFYELISDPSGYDYHELNKYYGFKYLDRDKYQNVLGFGSAYGEEFLPIIERINRLTILDPSDKFVRETIHGVPSKYVKPSSNGVLPFEDEKFDLISCLGVLHHIPNVTFVINEIYRCLEKNGRALIREPILTMGDWTKIRAGLTKRERGIPLNYMDKILEESGFRVVNKSLCIFPLIPKICNKLGIVTYNNKILTIIDRLASTISSRNITYHRTNIFQKLAPSSVYYILTK